MEEKPLSGTQFGESEYGQRLQYAKPVYRDIIFAILYHVHLIIVIGAGVYLWFNYSPSSSNNNDDDDWQNDINATPITVGVVTCAICGIIFGLLWLQIMKRFASTILKSMLFLNIAAWLVVAIIGFAMGSLGIVIIGIIIAVINALYTWCIWRRIPFASALLSCASSIISTYGGTIGISILVIVLDIVYIFIWGSCAAAYSVSVSNQNGLVVFLLLVAFYWAFQVNQNVSHTTTWCVPNIYYIIL